MDVNETENTETDSRPLFAQEREEDLTHMLLKVRFPSCRLVLIVMGFLGFVNVYILRVNLSIALVAMVNHTQLPYTIVSHNHSENTADDICKSKESIAGNVHAKSGEFNWDSQEQGTVLAAFFYGYIFTQV